MKAYDVALFLISVMLSINILSASGIFGTDVKIYFPQTTTLNNSLQSNSPNAADDISYETLLVSAFGLLVKTFFVIILIFAYSTILLPVFLNMLELPGEINAAITIIVWVTYIIGYAQYRGRTSLSGTE